MSHAEIWDDSELVISWNEALEEYKHYHSIHTRGEKIDDVLRSFNDKDNNPQDTVAADDGNQDEMAGSQYEDGITEEKNKERHAGARESENELSQADQALKSRPSERGSQRESPPLLQHFIGSVRDEGLKSLLMSWYYAGYYTGLYEGHRQGR